MSKFKTIMKAFQVSFKIKGIVSIIISLLGFLIVFLPVLLAERLRVLTDSLQTLSNGDISAVISAFLGLVALYLLQILLTNIQQYYMGVDRLNILKYIKKTSLRHKCEVKYKYIENYDDFQKRIAFTEEFAGRQMAQSINDTLTILQSVIAFAISAFALWQISPFIVITLFLTTIPAALLSYFQQEETFRGRAKWMEEGTLVIHYFQMLGGGHSLDGLQEIRHFALFDYLKARWRAIADEYIGKKNKVMKKHVCYNTLADFLRSAIYIVVLLITAYQIYENPIIGLGTFTFVFALSANLQTVTGKCLVTIMVLVQNIPYMEEFFNLDNLERDDSSTEEDYNDIVEKGTIDVTNLTFAYPNTTVDVLKNITVNIKDGEKIAIVGENGSGKSTFISLLCGMFDTQNGKIEIGGVDISKNPRLIHNSVSVVFQDFAHYEDSLRNNITVSDKHSTMSDSEIMEMLKTINVDDVILEQTNGLDELVGSFSEKANNLSGGQWQKISIARAAYRKSAKIMILDEPTSALDPIAETDLYRNFTKLTEDKTTILISHRLGITAMVDRILVFKDGLIIEDGSHNKLMEHGGHYANMYLAQSQWYE